MVTEVATLTTQLHLLSGAHGGGRPVVAVDPETGVTYPDVSAYFDVDTDRIVICLGK